MSEQQPPKQENRSLQSKDVSLKLDTDSKDIMSENLRSLKELFPSVIKDGTIDVEALKNIIGDISEPNTEYYNFTWAGKSDAFKIIKEKSKATLKPLKSDDESLNFENTGNIFIEGDNLEVLKILQKTYHNAIKMIYIDPPYNKDKDFVYPDKWSEGLESYLEYAKLVDEDGNITSSNAEDKAVKQGRKHSRWLTMMYPRLFLARNLLKDDGVIFISIDDDEVHNLRNICNEIFGEENFVSEFIWEKKKKPSFLHKNVGKLTEYILCYVKNSENTFPFSVETTTEGKKYPLNNAGNSINQLVFPPKTVKFNMDDTVIQPQDMSEGNIVTRLLTELIIKDNCNENEFVLEGEWRYSQTKINEIIENNETLVISKIPFRPNHIKAGGEVKKMKNSFSPTHYEMETNEDATEQLISLFKKDIFDNPKPIKLLKTIIKAITYQDEDKEDIILDFFAGSGSTAHAVMALNTEDGGNRKSISVQLPEHLDKKEQKEAISFLESIEKPTNIAEITKERIRRAGRKIKEENPDTTIDTGFKVFRLSESNFKKWDENIQTKEQLKVSLDLFVNNVKKRAKPLDMLYEVILSKGLSLNSTIDEVTIGGKSMYKVNSDRVELLACFEDEITKDALEAVVSLRPIYFICLDSSFKSDTSLKTNSVLNFKDADILFETV
jgi:adenine-specific DNA-methyltransferase